MKNIGLVVLALVSLLVLGIGFVSAASGTLNLFVTQLNLPSGALLIGGYALGVLATFALLAGRYSAKQSSTEKLEQWQAQDEKLLQQVQTDREKQLEAKIATLEAALQRALKK